MEPIDLIVIGSGAAGEGAIDQAHRSKHSIAIVEKDKEDGGCPNYACVPTTALLRSARIYSLPKRVEAFGLSPSVIEIEWLRVIARKERIQRTVALGAADGRRPSLPDALTGMAGGSQRHVPDYFYPGPEHSVGPIEPALFQRR